MLATFQTPQNDPNALVALNCDEERFITTTVLNVRLKKTSGKCFFLRWDLT